MSARSFFDLAVGELRTPTRSAPQTEMRASVASRRKRTPILDRTVIGVRPPVGAVLDELVDKISVGTMETRRRRSPVSFGAHAVETAGRDDRAGKVWAEVF
jgi:hypothetical protein